MLFHPFLEHLVPPDPAARSIQEHVDSLVTLGGEITRGSFPKMEAHAKVLARSDRR